MSNFQIVYCEFVMKRAFILNCILYIPKRKTKKKEIIQTKKQKTVEQKDKNNEKSALPLL